MNKDKYKKEEEKKMKFEHKKEMELPYSDIDSSAHFSLISILSYIQNIATEFFANMKSDNLILSTQNNALWVITKTKVKILKRPVWREKIYIRAYSVKVTNIKYEVEIEFKDENKETIIIAKQEYCVMDLDSHRIRKIETVNFPENLEVEDSNFLDDYKRLNEKFEEEDFVTSYTIGSQDIDFSKHTNNVAYARYLMNSFSRNFLDENEIDNFEIHYISESREGENLKIYKKNISDKEYEILLKEEDKDIARAYVMFK